MDQTLLTFIDGAVPGIHLYYVYIYVTLITQLAKMRFDGILDLVFLILFVL